MNHEKVSPPGLVSTVNSSETEALRRLRAERLEALRAQTTKLERALATIEALRPLVKL